VYGAPTINTIDFPNDKNMTRSIRKETVESANEELKKLLYSDLFNLEYSIIMEFEKPNKLNGITNITKTE
jgi:hypothetical protein